MADLTMLEVIKAGMAPKSRAPLGCPFCGEDPGLARIIHHRFIVGCESDDCHVCPQVSGDTLDEVWKRWNRRAPQLRVVSSNPDPITVSELEAIGAGALK